MFNKFPVYALCLLISFGLKAQNENFFSNTVRGSLSSKILGMEKNYQVALPESYHYSDKSSYPVIYIVDGDYNFMYMSGLVESYANVSEKIPESIVVSISDNGNEQYKKDCSLATAGNPTGNARKFLSYIEEELKPEINKNYKTSSYEVLIGHSLGGLFATTVFLEKQEAFDAYIVIDPSYWWDNNYIVSYADSLFKNDFSMNSQLFISLAETRMMGVHEMVGVLETYHSDSQKWSFNHYPDEDHGSVGVVTVKDGLQLIFKDWPLSRETFYTFESGKELMDFYVSRKEQYESDLRLPPLQFGSTLYFYFKSKKWDDLKVIESQIATYFPVSLDDYYSKISSYYLREGMIEEAQLLVKKSISSNKNAYKSHDILSKIYFQEKKFNEAESQSLKAISIAKELRARQWQINELQANLVKIQNEIGEE